MPAVRVAGHTRKLTPPVDTVQWNRRPLPARSAGRKSRARRSLTWSTRSRPWRVCRAVSLPRAAYYRKPADRTERDAAVIEVVDGVVAQRPRRGFRKCFHRLCLDGYGWNHERVYRAYCAMGLDSGWACEIGTGRKLFERRAAPCTAWPSCA